MASSPYFDRGTWYQKYKPQPEGKWVRVALCVHPSPWTKDRPPKKPPHQAVERAREFAEIEYRAKMGIGIAPTKPKAVSIFLDSYLEIFRASRKSGSVRQIERHVKSFFAFAENRGVTTIQGVSKSICRDYLEARFKGGASHNSLKAERGYLASIWSRAIEDKLMVENPWRNLKPPGKPAKADYTFWSEEEIEKIAVCCLKPWQMDLVRFLAMTGLRVSTGLASQWDWINWSDEIIRIPRGENIKTQYDHVLSEKAKAFLWQRLATEKTSTLIFPHPLNGKIIPYDTMQAAFKRAIIKSGVKSGTVHDLRHSYARGIVLKGGNIPGLQRQLGHASIVQTMKYSSSDAETVRAMLTKIDSQSPASLISKDPESLLSDSPPKA